MAEKHFVVIGDGPAGNQAARTIRENTPGDRVTLVSKGREGCYAPHRLPDLIAGKIGEDSLQVCTIDSYKALGIKLRCCQAVEYLDPAGKELLLEHKEVIPFDGLVIAVGGRPRIPERLSAYRDLMFTLKTLEDARVWKDRLQEADSVLMIGGDLTSLTMTRALLQLNKKVYLMLDEEAFWPLRCDKGLLAKVAHTLALKGVEVLIFRQIRSLARLPDGSCEVKMDEGTLKVDMVGAFFGLVPDVRFLARSGLTIDRGVLVDEYLNTGFGEIYATGDCAQIYHPGLKDYWVSIGYDNARLLGHIAGINLASGGMKVSTRPESVFDVKGIKVNTSWWMDF